MGDQTSRLEAQDAVDSRVPARSTPLFEQTVNEGVLFIDGQFVQPPYIIQASGNRVTVNGLTCFKVIARVSDQRSNPENRKRKRREESEEDPTEELAQPRSARQAAMRLTETLQDSRIVVANAEGPLRHLMLGGDVFIFCDAMLSADRSPRQIEEFVRLSEDETRFEAWRQLLGSTPPVGELRDRLQAYIDRIQAVEQEGIQRSAAITRMETFSYPLTLAGMLVGVIALGHVLKWTAKSIVAEQRPDYAPEVTRCVEIALLLMLAMSAIDLAWTILAGQAGAMREVNPLAAGFIQSPLQLVALKVIATGLGCGILYAWRQRQQIQDATWWMCLVCVLLTFRWVVFDSVIG
ncbi:MAG: hypothetical protein HQ518_11985 [Rhodopirellula sp.]|nr:hypothetical protein [Rhodopirellula sp.]